jgi:murein DD-endopeptidase MepM/ murein hydrolase activator NlpD
VHVVARGESLTGIARRHGTTVQALVERNDLLDPDRIEIGQRLLLPGRPGILSPETPPSVSEPALVDGMAWPVQGGRVLSTFGAPRGGRAHTGVDIGGVSGQPVLAADSGQVIFAGTLRGYGTTVVLEHGDGLRSLYAHNRELVVAVGDSVRRGDVIALLGRTGNATTDHCHFEVRRGEVPLDPLAVVTRADAGTREARP